MYNCIYFLPEFTFKKTLFYTITGMLKAFGVCPSSLVTLFREILYINITFSLKYYETTIRNE